MFLWRPIVFITSISDTRSDNSASVASSVEENRSEWEILRTAIAIILVPMKIVKCLKLTVS